MIARPWKVNTHTAGMEITRTPPAEALAETVLPTGTLEAVATRTAVPTAAVKTATDHVSSFSVDGRYFAYRTVKGSVQVLATSPEPDWPVAASMDGYILYGFLDPKNPHALVLMKDDRQYRWDVERGNEPQPVDAALKGYVWYSPPGNKGYTLVDNETRLQLWEFGSELRPLALLSLAGYRDPTTFFSPDETVILINNGPNLVALDSSTSAELLRLEGITMTGFPPAGWRSPACGVQRLLRLAWESNPL